MNNKMVRVLLALLCLSLFVMPVGCSDGENGGGIASVPTDDFQAANDTGKDSELYRRYAQYAENSSLAFKDCQEAADADFEYDIDAVGVAITAYMGKDNIVVLPQSIGGVPIVKICKGAFSGAGLRAVYIPDTVKQIEKGAFYECDGLTTLRLPFIGDGADQAFLGYIFGAASSDENAVRVPPSLDMLIIGDGTAEVADNALRGCKTLSAVVLSDTVASIGGLAFYECADLVYVSLGSGVESIGEYSFAYCLSLYSLDCSGVDEIGNGALYSCSSLNTIAYCPQKDDFLGRIFGAEIAEYNSDFVPVSLRNVTIAEGCDVIPNMAFSSCKYITSVTLPSSLNTVGVRAFYGCRSLREIKIPDSVKTIYDDAFFGCDAMTSAELGSYLESLGMQAFYGCKSLKSVDLPMSLQEIKPSTFYGCANLTSVSLGGVNTVGKDAFGNCISLVPISVDGITVREGNEALSGVSKD